MTCIVGITHRGRVWLGGDSASSGDHSEIAADPKVWRSGGVVIGGAGSWLWIDMLKRITCPDSPTEEWIRYGLTAAIRKMYTELGIDRSAAPEDEAPVFALVGALGSLYHLDEDLTIVRCGGQFTAIGVAELALGAMHAARGAPRARLTAGLEAAAAFSLGAVKPPFTFVSC